MLNRPLLKNRATGGRIWSEFAKAEDVAGEGEAQKSWRKSRASGGLAGLRSWANAFLSGRREPRQHGAVHGKMGITVFSRVLRRKASKSMRIVTLNANGIRSTNNKGLATWINSLRGWDVLPAGTEGQHRRRAGGAAAPKKSHGHFHHAEKKGYAGTALWSAKSR